MPIHRFRAPIVAIMLLVVLSHGATVRAQAAPSKVATANPIRIFTQIQKTKDLQSAMQTKTNALLAQRTAKANELKDLEAKRDLLNADSPERAALTEEIIEKTINLQAWMTIRKNVIEKEQKDKTVALYREILAAVRKIATQRGIQIVLAELASEFPADIDQATPQQVETRLAQRNILFTSAESDLTDAVITQMDADYKSGAAK